jgi:2-polyprenyl-3-methyl-5-hydroxy-6-metoxy-1,4-benzoquinol methylase
MMWTDPPEYTAALEQFLAPLRETVFWSSCWYSHTDVDHFQFVLSLLQDYTDIAGKRILDSGCGSGGLLIALRNAGAGSLLGVECDPNVYRLAVLRTNGIDQLKIVQDDTFLLQEERQSFDIIVSFHVIEHVSDYEMYIRAQATLLKPKGLLFIACPNRMWPTEAHSGLPLIHFLPRSLSRTIGKAFQHAAFLPAALRDQGRTSTLYQTDFTCFRLKKLLLKYGFEILGMNDSRHFISDLGMHRIGRALRRCIRVLPTQWQRLASILFSRDVRIVCQKKPL